ncbi:DinB superfamily protein [Lentzea albidocapillata subsp. violacea]|uniref:DinB superfamily protein n=1 Tax=Lentzea albidocapillata subsp. violacea TaxID=128104 RepID=A0A1G9YC84_9PSEU|nr:DinB family protein [Lentzea albidocapillata]SDN06670.1 DinB superfamily protein [Lentzea albidocapillata subsp. violacea]
MDKQAVHEDLDRACDSFRLLLDGTAAEQLRRCSNGTKWNNCQLLFHMLLGFLIMRALLALARIMARLPRWAGSVWARLLNAGTRPFDVVSFAGSWLGGSVMPRRAMVVLCDRTIAALHRRLDRESENSLAKGLPYPTRWDPFFLEFMTVADLYRFPVQHFDFHCNQLSLS